VSECESAWQHGKIQLQSVSKGMHACMQRGTGTAAT